MNLNYTTQTPTPFLLKGMEKIFPTPTNKPQHPHAWPLLEHSHKYQQLTQRTIRHTTEEQTTETEQPRPKFSPVTMEVPEIGQVCIREPNLETDKQGILDLYKAVSITPENIHEKVDWNHPNNFSKTGGFFKTLDENELQMRTENPEDIILIATNEKEEVIGYYVSHLDAEDYSNISHHNMSQEKIEQNPIHKQFLMSQKLDKNPNFENKSWQESFRNGIASSTNIAGSIDSMVLPEYQGKSIGQLLKYNMFKYFENLKKEYILFDVYTILSVETLEKQLNIENGQSTALHRKFGSIIGSLPITQKSVEDCTLTLIINVYLTSIQDAIKKLEKSFINKKIRTT